MPQEQWQKNKILVSLWMIELNEVFRWSACVFMTFAFEGVNATRAQVTNDDFFYISTYVFRISSSYFWNI